MSSQVAVKFPFKEKLPSGQTFIVDLAKSSHIDEFYRLFQDYTDEGIGFSQKEYATKSDFAKLFTMDGSFWMTVTDELTNSLVGLTIVLPGFLSRSTTPVTCGGYIILLPEMKGTGSILAQVIVTTATKLGYYAFLGRTVVNNLQAYLMTRRKLDQIALGIVPNGVNIVGMGWVDDIVIFRTLTKNVQTQKYKDPALLINPALGSIQPDNWNIPFDPYWVKASNGEKIKIGIASLPQKLEFEKWLQEQARNGNRIGIDEFTNLGTFNRKFFKKSITLVAETPKGTLCGAAIIGPTTLNRDQNPCTLHVYAFAPKNRALEEKFYRCAFKIALKYEMLGLITDVFSIEAEHIKRLMGLGFFTTASLPHCAFLQNEGYVDSLVMYLSTSPAYQAHIMSNI